MIALLITLGSIAAYLGVGWWIAIWDMPYLYERHARNSISVASVGAMSTATLLLWPFRLPFIAMSNAADKRDPERLEREIRERDRRIVELERNLRIDRSW